MLLSKTLWEEPHKKLWGVATTHKNQKRSKKFTLQFTLDFISSVFFHTQTGQSRESWIFHHHWSISQKLLTIIRVFFLPNCPKLCCNSTTKSSRWGQKNNREKNSWTLQRVLKILLLLIIAVVYYII